MLDFNNPSACGLAAARINALAVAAELVASGSSLTDRLQCESIASYLIGLAAELAIEIEEAADRAASMKRRQEGSHHGA